MSPELLKQKAREICYALIRVSYFIKRNDLGRRLERLAFEFLENAAIAAVDKDNPAILNQLNKNIAALDVLVRIGHSLYEIEPVNATILVRELDSFNSAIRQFAEENSAIAELPNLETIFTTLNQTLFDKKLDKKDKKQAIRQSLGRPKANNPAINPANNPATNPANPSSVIRLGASRGEHAEPSLIESDNPAIRQEAVIGRIRQSGNPAKLKDLIAAFPDVSERTLRYDLQSLCEQGVIERIGNSGPNTFYRIKS